MVHEEERYLLEKQQAPVESRKWSCLSITKAILLFGVIPLLVLAAILTLVWHRPNYRTLYHPDGTRLNFASTKHNLFLRNEFGSIVLTEDIPWLYGSSFEVHNRDKTCFQLRTMSNHWLEVDEKTGILQADTEDRNKGTFFSLVHMVSVTSGEVEKQLTHLKICGRNQWLEVRDDLEEDGELVVGLSSDSMLQGMVSSEMPVHWNSRQPVDGDSTTFTVSVVEPINGVNLGGWFIPEVWMNPSFSNGTGLGWAGSLCSMVLNDRKLTEKRIKEQLATWITPEDFVQIKADGFNSVRLPIGYWNLISDPHHLFAPADVEISLKYIDMAFTEAEKNGLTVLLDLHGLPGSQNGIDHSGCSGNRTFLENPDDYELGLKTVQVMAKRYGSRKSLLGFELVNEPAAYYAKERHGQLLEFYEKSYKTIRKYSKDAVVVFNELYIDCFILWENDLQEPKFYNIIMDIHLYNWQEPYTKQSAKEHVKNAVDFGYLIDMFQVQNPIIVGEWCFSTGTYVQAGQPFVDACVDSFGRSFGWYIWNWKIEEHVGFDEWNVQLQHDLPGGMRAVDKIDEEAENRELLVDFDSGVEAEGKLKNSE